MKGVESQSSRLSPAACPMYSHNLSLEAGDFLLLILVKCNLKIFPVHNYLLQVVGFTFLSSNMPSSPIGHFLKNAIKIQTTKTENKKLVSRKTIMRKLIEILFSNRDGFMINTESL